MKKLSDYKAKYDKLTKKRNLKGKEALEAVRQDGYDLAFVNEQTEEICLEAVKKNGYALRFVKEQTEEICLEAVKQNGYALRYVNEPMFGNVKERTLADVLAGLDAEDKAIVRAAVKE